MNRYKKNCGGCTRGYLTRHTLFSFVCFPVSRTFSCNSITAGIYRNMNSTMNKQQLPEQQTHRGNKLGQLSVCMSVCCLYIMCVFKPRALADRY